MPNPARLAADLSGRPLLLREASVPALAQLLGVQGAEERGLSGWLSRARRALAHRGDEAEDVTGPLAYAPAWLGEPDDVGAGWTLKGGVGCLLIDSCLMAEGFGWGHSWYHGYDTLLDAYEEMMADARVRAIWEVVDSPGGVVDAGLPELAAFKRASRLAAGGKPIVTFARSAYSAAYWIASSSDRIVTAREGGVGSIGAVVAWCGLTGLLEQQGVEYRAFKFGARKTDGSPFEALSETAAESLQAEIDQCGRWFVADVLAGRPQLTEAEVLATEAACYFGQADDPGRSGYDLKLVDEISTERAAFAALRDQVAASALSPAAPAAPAASKETDMKRSVVLAAARKAGLTKSQIRKFSAELPEDEVEDEDDPVAEGDEEEVVETDEEAADEDEDMDAEGDESDDVNARMAKAILALPEARGREQLAQALAFTPAMTASRARSLLAAAPKGGQGQLGKVLTDAPRLGPDVATPVAKTRSAREQFARNRPASPAAAR